MVAVSDAVRRATAYAKGVDSEIGAVRWIAEPGLRGAADAAPVYPASHLARAEAADDLDDPGEQLTMQVAVEPVAVEVTVEVALDLA